VRHTCRSAAGGLPRCTARQWCSRGMLRRTYALPPGLVTVVLYTPQVVCLLPHWNAAPSCRRRLLRAGQAS
jgi:hypothetical protein